MQTDFLFLLVRETNHAILSESNLRWLRFALLLELLRNEALWNERQESDWRADLQDLATELSALQCSQR